ncbi:MULTISPECIES: GH3 auxin-responsive promoter family protein [Sphingobacterium]|uniref:GH3 auxin-responsive promoter family protein n=1 Tax=Sphingobacterium litopenaei TaxID=2763500 RepID=A0ABR7YB14_9SPHI|nr:MULTISPECIES: GH3 auxin-responsive promoter family protein [Sphingobacterium]MBD1428480.1 GH3 auxin-responsive promoter family protein [Sphingobacterium litopenaei]NGM71716.1 GH3 auxin-responsive promoter family protein [Sphingobacterium sp. SGL-16]
MAIIGEIIKRAIGVTGIISSDPEPIKAQQEVLISLLQKAKNTAFGRKYNFENILLEADPIKAFQEQVPIYDYDKIHEEWWHYLHEGHENITWPGGQRYFALSSGTTSNSKAIPVTDDMLESIKKSGIQQILSLKNFDLPADFFEKDIMMLGSSTQLRQNNGFLEGEISGISAANIPLWFRKFYKPGRQIANSKEWDERVSKIVRAAKNWDIGSMTGIPSWSEILLKEIIKFNKVETIHDIWPNLRVYTTGGVAFGPYRKSFEKLFAQPMIYIDTYLASEGYLATQKRPDTSGMALIVDNGVFFEFVPFSEDNMDDNGCVKQNAQVLTVDQVEEGVEYVLLISTVSGAWRYMIGDTVMFTDKERAEIIISGRTKHFLNVVGEQLSVHQMNNAIQKLEEKFNLHISEFTVASIKDGDKNINRWYLGADQVQNSAEIKEFLDLELQENNKNYKVARHQALDDVQVNVIPVTHFYSWSENFKKLGGQTKIPRVMKEEDFEEFENYIKTL